MSRREPTPLLRVTALVAALCVFVLALLAASPELHAGLHATGKADAAHAAAPVGAADHVCAVTLFASGLTALLVFCLLVLGSLSARAVWVHAVDLVAAAHPRYRLVPAHAPPAA